MQRFCGQRRRFAPAHVKRWGAGWRRSLLSGLCFFVVATTCLVFVRFVLSSHLIIPLPLNIFRLPSSVLNVIRGRVCSSKAVRDRQHEKRPSSHSLHFPFSFFFPSLLLLSFFFFVPHFLFFLVPRILLVHSLHLFHQLHFLYFLPASLTVFFLLLPLLSRPLQILIFCTTFIPPAISPTIIPNICLLSFGLHPAKRASSSFLRTATHCSDPTSKRCWGPLPVCSFSGFRVLSLAVSVSF